MTRLLIDGEDYCEVTEIIGCPPFQGRSQHRLILSAPVHLNLLDPRRFTVRIDAATELVFDAYESSEDGMSLLGCPGSLLR